MNKVLLDTNIILDIAGVGRDAVLNALESEMADFEDAVQTESAKQNEI
nr:hypothetical protein [Bacteroidota bacterium]